MGAGGMGEVYEAMDTRLDRRVAIKILLEDFADSPERRARFEREAKAISQLNHPNICTLYDVHLRGSAEGEAGSADDIDYMVMEYVEGETLADRLKRGALPFDEALEYAAQIADGLDAAHRAGIVHRDLKPGNIMLTALGVKLLDFGLARFAADPSVAATSDAPTRQRDLTKEHAIVGTLQYMAPEQLEGGSVDTRADIWAFGAVLYEMLTGRKAFEGGSQASLVAAIMTGEAPTLSSVEPMSPPALDYVGKTCLEKNPKRRWQNVSDVARALAWSRESQAPPAIQRRRPTIRHAGLVAVALFFAGALLGAAVWGRLWSSTPTAAPVVRFAFPLPAAIGFSDASPPAIAPDGQHLVLPGADALYLKNIDELEAKPIPDTADAEFAFFSPNSRWVGFFTRGMLRKVPVAGGTPVTVATAPGGLIQGADWGKDGTIVFASVGSLGLANSSLWRVSDEGGAVEEIQRESLAGRALLPHLLPDGRRVLFSLETEDRPPQIVTVSLDTGETRILLEGSNARYLPTGHLVYGRAGTLLAVPFDPDRLEVFGTPVSVLDNIYSPMWGGTPIPQYSISSTGSLVYLPGGQVPRHQSRLVRVDRTGQVTAMIGQPSDAAYPRMSPDGERVALSMQSNDGRSIWMVDVARGAATRFTFGKTQYTFCWTPGGDRLTYHSSSQAGIAWKPLDGSGGEELLFDAWFWPISWSPDTTILAYVTPSPVTQSDIWVLSREPDAEPIAIARSNFNEAGPAFSPDGRFIAYVSDESGRDEVYIKPYPGPGEKKLVSTNGGAEPVWSRDGRELFYRNENELLAVKMGEELGQPELLFEKSFHSTRARSVGTPNYDVSADGESFIMLAFGEDATPATFNVVLNWFDELEQLVPIED